MRGEGTRLRPLTFERPKPCIPIVNRPSIQHLVAHLTNMGFREIVLTLGYMGRPSRRRSATAPSSAPRSLHVHEESKLGTAGSVKNAQKYLDGQDFLVVGGDHVTDLNMLEFYRAHQKLKPTATIGLISIEDPGEYGIAEIDVGYEIKRFKEKRFSAARSSRTLPYRGWYVSARKFSTIFRSARKSTLPATSFPI